MDRRDLKQEYSRRNRVVRKEHKSCECKEGIVRTPTSDRREKDGGKLVTDSLTDWKSVECMHKWRNSHVSMTERQPEGVSYSIF